MRTMRELARGEPGRDGKDGRDGRDGKSISVQRLSSMLQSVGASIIRRFGEDGDRSIVLKAPDVHVDVKAPDVTVAAPEITLEAHMPQLAMPDIKVHVAGAVVNVPKEAIAVKAEVYAPKPWSTETTITERDDKGRASVMETRPID